MTRFQLPDDWQVPDVFIQRLGDAAGRQRAMSADGHLLLILHDPPEPGRPDRTGRAFWRDPDGSWRSTGRGDGPQALQRHVAEFVERVDHLEDRWQIARSAADYYALLRAIAPLHRAVRNLHATLQEARQTVPGDRDLINVRDRIGETERAIELLHGDVKNGLEFTVAYQAERQADRAHSMAVSAHRLNLLVAVFFPVATLAAVFGMNLAHGLDGWNRPEYFWGLLVAGLVAGLVLARLIARKPPMVAPSILSNKVGAKRRAG